MSPMPDASNRPVDVTKPDPIKHMWALTDEVTRLRVWASDEPFVVPTDKDEVLIGTGKECSVRLSDPTGLVSRRHATLVRGSAGWTLHDLSKNGTRLDGVLLPSFALTPGCLIGIGPLTLIVESGRSVALRVLLARMFGWTNDRDEAIDLALQSIRLAAARRSALMLCSSSDPVSLAYQLHRVALGADRPFICCDRKRKAAGESIRSLPNVETGKEAFEAARGGALCVWASRLPEDFAFVRRALLAPDARVQLVVCATKPTRALASDFHLPPAIMIPSLAGRSKELGLVVDEYADDARRELGGDREHFLPSDRSWVIAHTAKSLAEIEAATLRIVALRKLGNSNRAADALGMAQVSISRWIKRHAFPWQPHRRP